MAEATAQEKELAAFFSRHSDELKENALKIFSERHPDSSLNSLPVHERREWISFGINSIIESLTSTEQGEKKIYYPSVSHVSSMPLFGMSGIVDACECALIPDESVLPLLWDDYSSDQRLLYEMILSYRRCQTRNVMRQSVELAHDVTRYLDEMRHVDAEQEEQEIKDRVYARFAISLRTIRSKTIELEEAIRQQDEVTETVTVTLTELKLLESDVIETVFSLNPELIVEKEHEADRPAQENGIDRFTEAARADGLSTREIRMVTEVAQGKSNAQISDDLSIAESTVKNYLGNIFEKLDMTNRTQVAIYAAEKGLFSTID